MTSSDTKACMIERERVLAAIARCEAKRNQQTDPLCRWYYDQCLKGWRQHLAALSTLMEKWASLATAPGEPGTVWTDYAVVATT